MQVSVEVTSGLERRVTVQVPGDEVKAKVEARLKEIGKQVKIKGFRPGRVPRSVLNQRYGKAVRDEIVGQEVQNGMQEAITQESLRPASPPRLDGAPDFADDGDLVFSALIDVFPELEDIDVTILELDKPETEINESDIDDMLVTLQEQRSSWQDVIRPADENDQVTIEYVADRDGVTIPETGKQRVTIRIGTEHGFDELDKNLRGVNKGDEKSLELSFPEHYREPELAGQSAKIDLTVTDIQELILPEINEDFVRSFGIDTGEIEALRNEVKSNLERELLNATTSFLKNQVVQSLIDQNSDLELPASMVEQEARHMQSSVQSNLPEGQEVPLESFMEKAERRVRGGLLMGEIGRQQSIRIDGGKVRETIERIASTYEEPREVVNLYYSNQELLQSVENMVLEEQVVDWVMENAKVTDKAMSFRDIITAVSQAKNA